jgi:hypothetical protein
MPGQAFVLVRIKIVLTDASIMDADCFSFMAVSFRI